MSCACKNKVNEKYVDGETYSSSKIVQKSGLGKLTNAVLQFIVGLLVCVIMFICMVPAVLYVMFCVCTGREMNVRIPNFQKWLRK